MKSLLCPYSTTHGIYTQKDVPCGRIVTASVTELKKLRRFGPHNHRRLDSLRHQLITDSENFTV